MQELQTAIDIAVYCIENGKKHKFHKRNVDDSIFYKSLVMDNDAQDDIIRDAFPSEMNGEKDSDDMVRRLKTKKKAGSALSVILRPYNIIKNLEPKTQKIECENEKDTDLLVSSLQDWNGTQSNLIYYLCKNLMPFNVTDANAVLVLDIESFDSNTEKPKCNSWFANSQNIFNYKRKNNIYEWILFSYDEYHNGMTTVSKKRFVYFNDNISVVFEALEKDDSRLKGDLQSVDTGSIGLDKNAVTFEALTTISKQKYYIRINRHNLGIVPVLNVSNNKAEPNVDVFNSLIYPIRNEIAKLVVRNTEENMMFANHASPRVYEYQQNEPIIFGVDACDDGNCGNCSKCNNGAYRDGDSRGGTQKKKVFDLPKMAEDFISLKEMYAKFSGDIASVEYFRDDLQHIVMEAYRVFYGTELIDKGKLAGTATESLITSQKEADAVHGYLNLVINVAKRAIDILARYLDIKACNVQIRYPSKLQSQTLDELYLELEKARKTSNGSDIKQIIDTIIQIKHKDEPSIVLHEKVWSCLNPTYYRTFAETVQTIAISLNDSDLLSENEKYLAMHYEQVKCYVEAYVPNFYDMEFKKQVATINDIIDNILSENTTLNEIE